MSAVATCALGLEPALARELTSLGLEGVEEGSRAVTFAGDLGAAYRACLWSRVATRVLWPLRRCFAGSTKALYAELRKIPWAEHLHPKGSLAVHFVGTNDAIRNSKFGAQKVKDAIVDALRDEGGGRPSVDLDTPDVRIHVALRGTWADVSIDLSGDPLHLRGFGRDGGEAPLKETLAAGIAWLSGVAEAPVELPVVDPMCGSGTFLLEVAAMRRNRAPGLTRERWGFSRWLGHEEARWEALVKEAEAAQRSAQISCFGGDVDPEQIRRVRSNLRRAGLEDDVRVAVRDLSDWEPPPGPGFVLANPPYGERLGEEDEVAIVWRTLGDVLRQRFLGYDAWLLAGIPALAKRLGLRPKRRIPLRNGPLEGRLLHVPIADRAPSRLQ